MKKYRNFIIEISSYKAFGTKVIVPVTISRPRAFGHGGDNSPRRRFSSMRREKTS